MAAHADSLLAINVKCNNLQVGNDDNHGSLWSDIDREERQSAVKTGYRQQQHLLTCCIWQGAGWQQLWWQPCRGEQLSSWWPVQWYQEIISLPSAILWQWVSHASRLVQPTNHNCTITATSHFSATPLDLNFTFYHPRKQTECNSILAS